MATRFRLTGIAGLVVAVSFPLSARAQDITLAAGGADMVWRGTRPTAAAGLWLDQGAVSNDPRRDLVIGAPGGPGISGAVYVVFGGPPRSGDVLLSTVDVVITSTEAGNRFGAATAVGNIRNTEGTTPRNLVVGAPGAQGGRGAAYLFAGIFNNGARLTAAGATAQILGAPGDQLGTAIGTGDLNGDGYREIILGAPGNHRVYIIQGGPTLSGTIDLTSTSAAHTITAAGIGTVIGAGDVTSDGIYDLLLGAPAGNVAFLFPGRAGALSTLTADGAFLGVDAGDNAGAGFRLLDLDSDGRLDITITAPTADGPGNTRPDGGEAYVFFGPIAGAGARSLGAAHVIFYGSAAGMRLGDRIHGGDINRDTPNDLVFLEPAGSGGAGVVQVYYGRRRSAIGQLQGATRIVDFAAVGQANRRIFGDASTGPIRATHVFEVTGEGARDIVVSVPSADSGAGKVFLTISPKLRISPASMSFFVNQGASATSPTVVNVINPSTIPVGWQVSANQPWLSGAPGGGIIDHTHPATVSVSASAASLSPGTYTGRVTVSSTSDDLEMALPIDVTVRVTGTRVAIEAPANNASVSSPFTVSGWSIDTAATSGTGVDALHVYAYPASGANPIFLGQAVYGAARPDIGAQFGGAFTNSGYSLSVSCLATGSYTVVVFPHSTVSNSFANAGTAAVNVTSTNPPPCPNPGTNPAPVTRLAINRTALRFGAIQNGAVGTPAQSVMVNFTGGTAAWSVAASANWIEVVQGSGSGNGGFTVRVRAGSYSAGLVLTGSVTVTAPGVPNSPITIPVTFRSLAAGANPAGFLDTPADNVTGVSGALAVTGWAVDDIEVRTVSIWRDPVAGEGSGPIFVGNANFVDGARPDVDAAFDHPLDYKAGWGMLILTNMLPNQGNGSYRLIVYANDAEGHSVLLGTRRITCDNAHATKPFGTIDTPDQGGSASGSSYLNFGWALTQQPKTIPTNGSTIMVYVDGVPVGRPTYNQHRADIATLLPGYSNSEGAVGYLRIDTTALTNGVHTIHWSVTDNAGNSEGIGSRYFTVVNGSPSSSITVAADASVQTLSGGGPEVREAAGLGAATGRPVSSLAALPEAPTVSYVRVGANPSAPLDLVETDAAGVRTVVTSELQRIELTVGAPLTDDAGGYEGYLISGSELHPLPTGAFLDRRIGMFFWQPGAGFIGTYRFVFVRSASDTKERIPVTVRIGPQR